MTFYVEKSTRLIYEVKLFDDFVLARPASRDFGSVVERIPLMQFAETYEEYWGLHEQVRERMTDEVFPDPSVEIL